MTNPKIPQYTCSSLNSLVKGVVGGLLLSCFSCQGQREPESQRETDNRPHIIFIFADDWGYGDLKLIYKTIAS
jgi:N-acetylgalactosamine-6-sulfatase